VLRKVEQMSSDYESTEMLLELAPCAGRYNQVRQAYLEAAKGISSDYEFKRAVVGLIRASDIDSALVMDLLPLVTRMSSDYEKGEVLKKLANYCRGNDKLEEAFEDAIESLDSEYEKKQFRRFVIRVEYASGHLEDFRNILVAQPGGCQQ